MNSMAAKYGFNPLPRSQEKLLKGHKKDSPYIPISEIAVPDTKIVHAVNEYVKKELSPETYNHCMRIYFYGISTLQSADDTGQAIVRNHFPEWEYTNEVGFLLKP